MHLLPIPEAALPLGADRHLTHDGTYNRQYIVNDIEVFADFNKIYYRNSYSGYSSITH